MKATIKILTLAVLTACIAVPALAQKSKKADIEAIKEMCGCFKVRFNFAETFAPDKDYQYHDNYYSGGLEYAIPVEISKDKVVIQHLLVINDSTVIKHWRQDWLYENTALYTFHKNSTWQFNPLDKEEVKGQWTQKVYQVDDSPRYEASGSWVHKDGRHYWETVADAPLPRREFSKRDDYNVLKRRNRQEITEQGWVHEQDNDKIIRTDSDELLAQEKGWNTYTRIADSQCQPAIDWWKENAAFWSDVRDSWDTLFAQQQTVKVTQKIDGEMLMFKLFALGDEYAGDQYQQEEARQKIDELIRMHTSTDQKISAR